MNTRTLSILASLLATLIVGSILLWSLSRPAKKVKLANESFSSKVVRLEISGPHGGFKFSKSSQTWRMDSPISYPADANAFGQSVGKLSEVTVSETLTEEKSRYDVFGLTDSSATHVRVFSSADGASPDLDFFVGKEGSEYGTFFMRWARGPEVVQSDGISSREFAKLPGEWLDKVIVAVSSNSIIQLNIRNGKESVKLNRSGGRWFRSSGKALPASAVEESLRPMLGRLERLDADRVLLSSELPAPAKTGLSQPEMTVEIQSPLSGQSVTLKIGKKDDRGYRHVGKSGESRVYFLVMDWKLEPFRKKF